MNRLTGVESPTPHTSAGHGDLNADGPAPLVFESSWEICQQAGGIYTVLRSKAPAAVAARGDSYWLLGPYRELAAKIEFEFSRPGGPIGEALHELSERGIHVHAGRWLVTGRPQALLIDTDSAVAKLHEIKYFLWKDHGISVPDNDVESDEVAAYGYLLTELLSAIHRRLGNRPMIAQFHEWQGASAIPMLKHRKVAFPTIFTTHATLVGRSLSAANQDLYGSLETIDAEAVATEHGILHRFLFERAAAQQSDVFTTVSEITAQEAEFFLGRVPDALLPNGLNVERFAAPHEFQNLHQQAKEQIHEFVRGHFFPSYTFDLNRTIYVFTAGRYEFRNKGYDVFIEALHELNRRLKAQSEGVTVVAFLVTRAPYRQINNDTLNRQAMYNEMKAMCGALQDRMGKILLDSVADGRLPDIDELMDESSRVRLKRMMHAWRIGGAPIIVTHDLEDDISDPILRHLRHRKLLNAAEDPVKVIFHPEFIAPTSPLLGIEYDQFVRGCNLGVFPSYYEPWGYTPMECIIRGVPGITSDLSGFGSYVMDHFPDHDAAGMYVNRRRGVSFETSVYQVAGWMHNMTRMGLRNRIELRNRVEQHAEHFSWSKMVSYYQAARRMAFEMYYPNRNLC